MSGIRSMKRVTSGKGQKAVRLSYSQLSDITLRLPPSLKDLGMNIAIIFDENGVGKPVVVSKDIKSTPIDDINRYLRIPKLVEVLTQPKVANRSATIIEALGFEGLEPRTRQILVTKVVNIEDHSRRLERLSEIVETKISTNRFHNEAKLVLRRVIRVLQYTFKEALSRIKAKTDIDLSAMYSENGIPSSFVTRLLGNNVTDNELIRYIFPQDMGKHLAYSYNVDYGRFVRIFAEVFRPSKRMFNILNSDPYRAERVQVTDEVLEKFKIPLVPVARLVDTLRHRAKNIDYKIIDSLRMNSTVVRAFMRCQSLLSGDKLPATILRFRKRFAPNAANESELLKEVGEELTVEDVINSDIMPDVLRSYDIKERQFLTLFEAEEKKDEPLPPQGNVTYLVTVEGIESIAKPPDTELKIQEQQVVYKVNTFEERMPINPLAPEFGSFSESFLKRAERFPPDIRTNLMYFIYGFKNHRIQDIAASKVNSLMLLKGNVRQEVLRKEFNPDENLDWDLNPNPNDAV